MIGSLIVIIISAFIFHGCVPAYSEESKQNNSNPVKEDTTIYSDSSYDSYHKITIEVDGIRHEYLRYKSYRQCGLTHYPECKYCKEKNKK